MRIREILFQDFRCFRGRHQVSFVDPSTGGVRPVSILVGADRLARQTVLEAIEALLSYAADPRRPRPLVEEALGAGWMQMAIELTPADLEQFYQPGRPPIQEARTRVLRIEVGRRGVVPLMPVQEWSTLLACLSPREQGESFFTNAGALSSQLFTAVSRMQRGADLHGGLLYFPGPRHDLIASGCDAGDSDAIERAWIVRARAAVEALALRERRDVESPVDAAQNSAGLALLAPERIAARPGAVIAIEDPAILAGSSMPRVGMEGLRELVQRWDAQLIVAADSEQLPPAFREEERISLDRQDPAA
jgi:hypothetical protein